jgi:uncharacterized secreted protein with C-terminal beta-propeller domain
MSLVRRITQVMKLLSRLALLVVAAVAAAAVAGTSGRSAPQAAKPRLAAFGSCGQLLDYAKGQAARFVGPYGLGGFGPGAIETAAPAPTAARAATPAPVKGVDYSGTNVQEEGVDEPDLVKTDGKTLFTVGNGKLRAVDVGGAKPRLLDSLPLANPYGQELLLHGDRLLLLSNGGYWIEPLPALPARMMPYRPAKAVLTEIDVSDPAKLRLVRTLELDGSYVAARLVGSVVRIVSSAHIPTALPFVQPTDGSPEATEAAEQKNKSVVANTKVTRWLPSYRIKRAGKKAGAARPLVQCRHVRRAASFSGLGMLTILTVDLAKGLEPVDSAAVMTDGRVVYASPDSLYVATERWTDRPDPAAPSTAESGARTEIHKFDISSPVKTHYRGSGTVPGYLLSQWSLSEYRGVLRVVSTETPAWWGAGRESESSLTTLRPAGGALVQAGRIGELGKGERVYAVRFVGDTGYVVTFKQVDPLYTVDLADPARPRVLGQLKIPGYSAYLHPIGPDLLLGVGQDVDANGRPQGTQLSLFDVSDLRHPARVAQATLGLGWSEAESDHHAFLYWPKTGLAVLPFDQRAVGFRVGRSSIERVGTVAHAGSSAIRRSLVVGPSLLTVSDGGVLSSALATFAERGWAGFPAPEPTPVPGPIRR